MRGLIREHCSFIAPTVCGLLMKCIDCVRVSKCEGFRRYLDDASKSCDHAKSGALFADAVLC